MATCQGRGCNTELPPNRRKWCSVACRRRTLYAGTCRTCGCPTDGSNGRSAAPEYCGTCAHAARYGERNRRLVELWTADVPTAEIAAQLGMNESAVVESARRLRRRGEPVGLRALSGRGEVVRERDDLIVDLWNAGVSSEEIARRLGFASARSLVARVSVLRRAGRDLNPRAHRLSPREVSEIRDRYAAGGVTQATLALAFGVHKDTIQAIVAQRTHLRRKAAA